METLNGTERGVMKVIATIEARMGSTRLPGKVLREVVGVPLLGHLISRLQACDKLDDFVVATTTSPADDVIDEYCQSLGVAVFRGDEDDVLGRVLAAASSLAADVVVETTGDNPLLDPSIVDLHVETFLSNTADYVSNAIVPTFPDGMEVQVFSLETLRRSEAIANHPSIVSMSRDTSANIRKSLGRLMSLLPLRSGALTYQSRWMWMQISKSYVWFLRICITPRNPSLALT